nr:unnamed protein product [Digitaria exilis]
MAETITSSMLGSERLHDLPHGGVSLPWAAAHSSDHRALCLAPPLGWPPPLGASGGEAVRLAAAGTRQRSDGAKPESRGQRLSRRFRVAVGPATCSSPPSVPARQAGSAPSSADRATAEPGGNYIYRPTSYRLLKNDT